MFKKFAKGSLALLLITLASCGGPKYNYKSADFSLSYLQNDRLIENDIRNLIRKTNTLLENIPDDLKANVFPINEYLVRTIRPKSEEILTSSKEPLNNYLSSYDVFWGEPVYYQKIENENLKNNFVTDVNRFLKDSYKVTGSIDLAKTFLRLARKDAEWLKSEVDPVKSFGVSVVSLETLNFLVDSYNKSNDLLKISLDLTEKSHQQLKTDPELAQKVVSELVVSSINLGKLKTEVVTLLKEVTYLLKEIEPLINQEIKPAS